MLKWTVSQQRFLESSSLSQHTFRTPKVSPTKRKRRATIANKENIITSTPMAPSTQKFRYSPLVLAPLTDILNITPEPVANTPEQTVPQQYASTLPRFEEEYSPSTLLPGQLLAMRGLLPDSYHGRPRYITNTREGKKSLPKKRKLNMELLDTEPINQPPKINASSAQLGDQTLDKLIDAILDSARKDKKKKSRRSFNLRRKTLLKNTTEHMEQILSPSYTPGDDPASDLSLFQIEPVDDVIVCETPVQNPLKKSRREIADSEDALKPKALKKQDDCMKYFEVGVALPSIYV